MRKIEIKGINEGVRRNKHDMVETGEKMVERIEIKTQCTSHIHLQRFAVNIADLVYVHDNVFNNFRSNVFCNY